jgi:hypothetical protein
MVEDPHAVIGRLTKTLRQQIKDNAALLKTIARQKRQIATRDAAISKLEEQQVAMTEQIRSAFTAATAYVEAELPKQLEPVLAELNRLQDAEWLREIGDVDPKDAN